MIGPNDRLSLPEGIELRGGAIHDPVRASPLTVNATGLIVLAAPTPAAAAAELGRSFGVRADVALADALQFCAELNARLVLNVRVSGGRTAVALRWLRRAPYLLPLGLLPRVTTTRRAVDTHDPYPLACSAVRALAAHALLVLVVGSAVAALVLAALGTTAPTLALAVGLAVAATIALHELAHLSGLLHVPACVVTRGLHVRVVHRAVSRTRARIVAALGPGLGLVLAAGWVAAVHAAPHQELAIASLVAQLNAIGLTVVSRDGRTLCGLC